MKDKKIILVQLGSPKSTATSDVRNYLRDFLGDPRVVDLNPFFWKIILNLFVLPFRPKKSAEAYQRIWDEKRGSPLVYLTEDLVEKLKTELPEFKIEFLNILTDRRIIDYQPDPSVNEYIFVPLFPQYSESTIASAFDQLAFLFFKKVNIPNFKFISYYHRSKVFIDHSVRKIKEKNNQVQGQTDYLIISFHGIPTRRVAHKKDVYFQQCIETFYLMKEKIDFISQDKILISFQSRFGSEPWLIPATDELVPGLVKDGPKNIVIYCASFLVDCLETLDEIGNELEEEIHSVNKDSNLYLVNCLNDDPEWCRDFASFIRTTAIGSLEEQKQLNYEVDMEKVEKLKPEQIDVPKPLDQQTKSTLKLMFFTVFLDIVGFSIIFPMFPAMAEYYMAKDANNFFLTSTFGFIDWIVQLTGGLGGQSQVVLFGGVLGALYSFLQFIFSPIWGGLSDRMGRKPILGVTIFGLALSYLVWIFAGNFTLLLLARFFGGLMAGNLSTVSAVASDVTTQENRSKAMAIIGIAFAFGFIIGPAMGGISALWNPVETFPQLAAWGVNPFSFPAAIAFVLCSINFLLIYFKFKETNTKKEASGHARTANPFVLFKPLANKQVNIVNFSYFLFIAAFSGMEFTLTFLAVERLAYQPIDNGFMFIYIGFLIAMVQGGFVRRKANQMGEKKVALYGLCILIPGLIWLAYTNSSFGLYGGLTFLSIGSAMIIPCLTALASILAPDSEQGRVLGIFRSLGSLGRVIGPFMASIIYYRLGSGYPYLLGSISLLLPILLLSRVKHK